MEKCLVIQTAFIGDVILATPVPHAIKQIYPETQVDMLVRQGNETLLKNNPKVDQTLIWHKKSGKYQDWWRLLKTVRAEGYDWVINIQRFGATGLLTALSGAKTQVGFEKTPFSSFFTNTLHHQIGKLPNSPHEVDRNLSLVYGYYPEHRLRPALYPDEEDYAHVEPYKECPYICMAPASVWYTKQFPSDRWVELLDKAAMNQYPIFLLGAPDDYDFCEKIQQDTQHPQVTNLAGQLTFLQTAALMEKAHWNYVNDSAPLHIASAMNARVTAIFCSTIPEFGFGPLSDESHVAQVDELYCRPCSTHGKKICPEGHFRCAYDINLEKLLKPIK